MNLSIQAFVGRLVACIAGITMLCTTQVNAASITAEEPQLRAAVIMGILQFTNWPGNLIKKTSFNICTDGKPIAEQALLKIPDKHKVAGRPVRVYVINDKNRRQKTCDTIVYGPAARTVKSRTNPDASNPILGICDGCRIRSSVMMVTLKRRESRIGFEINLGFAKQNGISFSSSLLELAMEVIK